MRTTLPTAIVLAAVLHTAPADARYDERDALRDCENKVFSDNRFDRFYALEIRDVRNHAYTVEGKVAMANAKDPYFDCSILHREVVAWRVDDRRQADDGLLIGGGILGAAVIDLIAAEHQEADAHLESRRRYVGGHGFAFDDQRYLEEECRRAITRNLEHGHAGVDRLDLGRYQLKDRELQGKGEVRFRRGNHPAHQLAFHCVFDRRGRIIDGRYQYY